MPYISIKGYPKDDETKRRVVEEINEVMLRLWKCPPEAITISLEEVAPEDWQSRVRGPEIESNADRMMILDGKKNY